MMNRYQYKVLKDRDDKKIHDIRHKISTQNMLLNKPVNIVSDIVSLNRYITPIKKKVDLLDSVIQSQSVVKDERLKRIFKSGKYNIHKLVKKVKKKCEDRKIFSIGNHASEIKRQDTVSSLGNNNEVQNKSENNKIVLIDQIKKMIRQQRVNRIKNGDTESRPRIRTDDGSVMDISHTSLIIKKSKVKWEIRRAKEEAKEIELLVNRRIENKNNLLKNMIKSKLLQSNHIDTIFNSRKVMMNKQKME